MNTKRKHMKDVAGVVCDEQNNDQRGREESARAQRFSEQQQAKVNLLK